MHEKQRSRKKEEQFSEDMLNHAFYVNCEIKRVAVVGGGLNAEYGTITKEARSSSNLPPKSEILIAKNV